MERSDDRLFDSLPALVGSASSNFSTSPTIMMLYLSVPLRALRNLEATTVTALLVGAETSRRGGESSGAVKRYRQIMATRSVDFPVPGGPWTTCRDPGRDARNSEATSSCVLLSFGIDNLLPVSCSASSLSESSLSSSVSQSRPSKISSMTFQKSPSPSSDCGLVCGGL